VVRKEVEEKMKVEEVLEDLVKVCIDSYNIILQGSFNGKMSDDVSNHLKLCLQIIDACTVKESEDVENA
jgi:hypothetical protein